jgi:hypothetical protein
MIARKQSHAILGYYKVSCELLKRMSTNNVAKRSFVVCMKGRESGDGLEKGRRKYLRLRAVDDVHARYMEEAERDDLDDSCRGVDVWVMERSACASEEVLKGYEKVRFWSSCFVLFCSVCLARARERESERERESSVCVVAGVF